MKEQEMNNQNEQIKTPEDFNGDLILYFEYLLNQFNEQQYVQVPLRYLDCSFILTAIKTIEFYNTTFIQQMKLDLVNMKKIENNHKT